jgi:TonB-dependent starch-binding outer membrane protein SusC
MYRRGTSIMLGLVLGTALLFGGPAAAQQQPYTIAGRVVDASGAAAIQGAQVSLRGTGAGGLTNNAGAFSFTVNTAPGDYVLEVAFIGRETIRRTVTLGATPAVRVPDIALAERPLELDAVVVTGTAAPTARRAIGNAVSTVSARELQNTPATTIDQALQGRVSGAVITSNTGTPGGGVSIRLRGTSSITGGAEPLFIIDGVIIDNNADQQLNLGYRSNASNRLADLDPNDIERIEVLKGAAAAALYGSRANNGVVQIFTRRGSTGAPQITVSSRIGRSELERRIQFAMTPLGFPGGSLTATTRVDTVRYDPQDLIFRNGLQMDHHVSLAGGGGDTRYYLSAGYTEDTGIMRGAGHDKLNVRMNLDQGFGAFQLSAGANYIRSNTDLVINGEQGEGGLLTQIVFTPTSRDLTARNPETGRFLFAGGAGPNPLEVLEDWDHGQQVNRFIGSLQGRWSPWQPVTLEYRLGYDNYQMETTQFIPNGSSAAATGRAVSLNRFSTLINNDLIGSVQWSLGNAIALTTSAGMNHTYTQAENLNATSNELPPGTQLVRGAIQFASQSRTETATFGFFGQQQVGLSDRLFLTGALRMDASSTFGADERWQMYPKVSGSWVLSEEPFFRDAGIGGWLNQLRLRAALGYAGNQPPLGSAYARFSRWAGTVNINRAGLIPLAQLGNPELRPERQREVEAGVDISVFNERAALAFTYYNQYTRDLLLSRPFAPSTGVGSRLENVGELSNRGIELQLNTLNIEQGPFRWTSTAIYSRNRNRLERLEIAPYTAGYTNRVVEGHPIGVHFMATVRRDDSGNILSDSIGPLVSLTPQIVGSPWPEWTGSLSNEFGWGSNWSASFMLDGQFGHQLWNQTQRIQDIFGAGPLFDRLIRGEITQAQRARHQAIWSNYLEDASFVKLRQIALRYSTSAPWLRNVGANSMQIELLGRNLKTWTDYTGYDPEINMFGLNTVERGTDFAVYPNARTYTIGIRLTH